MSTGLVLFLTT